MTGKGLRLLARVKESLGEDIVWDDDTNLLSAKDTAIYPDLVGRDSKGLHVIVEVKSEFVHENDTTRRDAEYKSVGQILDYVTAYMEQHYISLKDLRLLIVGDYLSETVDKICLFLCERGIFIEHISVGHYWALS